MVLAEELESDSAEAVQFPDDATESAPHEWAWLWPLIGPVDPDFERAAVTRPDDWIRCART
ncbi:hypothetical protein [Burkholderia catarinensis]|uniref:hypothetical protein n=1 Tax=Burkholderia catarinensis TaxID=1108140 RepID=UPI001FE6B4E4|nr:hypothetical protein [Burkholderia catarinensis]